MKNKRGLFGAIFLAIIIVLLVAGFLIYSQVKKSGLTLSSGDITVKINYNKSASNQIENQMQDNVSNNNSATEFKINETEINSTSQIKNNSNNETFIIIEEVNQSQ